MRAHTMSYLTRDTCPQLESVDDLPLVQPVPDTLHGAYHVCLPFQLHAKDPRMLRESFRPATTETGGVSI